MILGQVLCLGSFLCYIFFLCRDTSIENICVCDLNSKDYVFVIFFPGKYIKTDPPFPILNF